MRSQFAPIISTTYDWNQITFRSP